MASKIWKDLESLHNTVNKPTLLVDDRSLI